MSTIAKPSRQAITIAAVAFATALGGCGERGNAGGAESATQAQALQGTTPAGATGGRDGTRSDDDSEATGT